MSKRTRVLVGVLLFVGLLLGSAALLRMGFYGWTIFVVLPFCAGALASWIFLPSTSDGALAIGALPILLACGVFLLVNIEGIICVGMSLP